MHVYVNSDYDTVNEFYRAYGGDVIDRLIVNPAWMVSDKIQEWFPDFTELLQSIGKLMWENVGLSSGVGDCAAYECREKANGGLRT